MRDTWAAAELGSRFILSLRHQISPSHTGSCPVLLSREGPVPSTETLAFGIWGMKNRLYLLGSTLASWRRGDSDMPATSRPVLHHKDQIVLKAAPEKAWDTIKHFDSIHKWHPAAQSTELLLAKTTSRWPSVNSRLEMAATSLASCWPTKRRGCGFSTASSRRRYLCGGTWVKCRSCPTDDGGSLVEWSAPIQRPDEIPQPGRDDAATVRLCRRSSKQGLRTCQSSSRMMIDTKLKSCGGVAPLRVRSSPRAFCQEARRTRVLGWSGPEPLTFPVGRDDQLCPKWCPKCAWLKPPPAHSSQHRGSTSPRLF